MNTEIDFWAMENISSFLNVNQTNETISVENKTDDYSYDYDEAIGTFFWEQLIPPLIVYSLTFAVGIIGNSLIIYTIAQYRRLKSTTNVFLASLASADLLVILVCIPVKLARLFSYSWTFGMLTCKIVYYVQSVSAICSVFTLTSMSVERYYAIVYPMKAQYQCTISKAKRICFCIWVVSLLLASPTIFAQIHMAVGWRRTAYWCVRDFDSLVFWPAYETYVFVTVLFLPATIMGAAYFSIYTTVCAMAASRRKMVNYHSSSNSMSYINEKQRRKEEHEASEIRQVVTMLVVVVLLFVLCWAPILLLNVLKSFGILDKYSLILRNIATAADLLSYCNSCVNPVVYGFMSKNFRESFFQALCCHRFHRKRSLSSHLSLSTTRVSVVRRNDSCGTAYSAPLSERTYAKSSGYRAPGNLCMNQRITESSLFSNFDKISLSNGEKPDIPDGLN